MPLGVLAIPQYIFVVTRSKESTGIRWLDVRMLLNIIQCTRQLPTTNNYLAKMSTVSRLRNSAIKIVYST